MERDDATAHAIVDAILTSMAEQGFREVVSMGHPDYDCDGSVSVDGSEWGAPTPVYDKDTLAVLKPLPPAKED